MKALTFSKFGTSDVLEYIEVPKPKIKRNEILIENKAIGLNLPIYTEERATII